MNIRNSKKIKTVLKALVKEKRFNGNTMYNKIHPILQKEFPQQLPTILSKLDRRDYAYVITALIRNVFLIEIVNDEISSTKMEVRWTKKKSASKKQEKFDNSDPRFCSFDECCIILEDLLNKLSNAVQDIKKACLLHLYSSYALLPYEIPIDYVKIPSDSSKQIHFSGNLEWVWDDKFGKTLELREILLSNKNPLSNLFSSILKDKIKVKTYLTDRVQTGKHKTNREKRWEVHPESVHFASRKECLLVELRLVSQLCYFEEFPKDIFDLVKDKIIHENEIYRCPVTLNPLKFSEFRSQIENPSHGKSDFHVGHLNPLKLNAKDRASGHTEDNIGWFSDDGNRIQGSLSLDETRNLLSRIYKNYKDTGKKDQLKI